MASRREQRKLSFKKGIDPTDERKKREDEVLSIRKSRREEGMRKRRNLGAGEGSDTMGLIREAQEVWEETLSNLYDFFFAFVLCDQFVLTVFSTPLHLFLLKPPSHPSLSFQLSGPLMSDFAQLSHLLINGSVEDQLCASIQIRILLSSESRPPIQEVIDAGFVPIFVSFLRVPSNPEQLLYESSWILTNITSG